MTSRSESGGDYEASEVTNTSNVAGSIVREDTQRERDTEPAAVGATMTSLSDSESNELLRAQVDQLVQDSITIRAERDTEPAPALLPFGPPPGVTPIDELRGLVATFSYCNETFLQRFDAVQLLQLCRALRKSEWDFLPDQWHEQQVQDALRGVVPQWDDLERPILEALPNAPQICFTVQNATDQQATFAGAFYGTAVGPLSGLSDEQRESNDHEQ